jgi:hypothetical protein
LAGDRLAALLKGFFQVTEISLDIPNRFVLGEKVVEAAIRHPPPHDLMSDIKSFGLISLTLY